MNNEITLCEQCGKQFTRIDNFKRHYKEKHTDLTDFQCNICFGIFTRKESVRKHEQKYHKELNTDNFSKELINDFDLSLL